jgi:hypothetical protein
MLAPSQVARKSDSRHVEGNNQERITHDSAHSTATLRRPSGSAVTSGCAGMLKTSFGFICDRLSSASAADARRAETSKPPRSIGAMIDRHNHAARAASKPTLLGGVATA